MQNLPGAKEQRKIGFLKIYKLRKICLLIIRSCTLDKISFQNVPGHIENSLSLKNVKNHPWMDYME